MMRPSLFDSALRVALAAQGEEQQDTGSDGGAEDDDGSRRVDDAQLADPHPGDLVERDVRGSPVVAFNGQHAASDVGPRVSEFRRAEWGDHLGGHGVANLEAPAVSRLQLARARAQLREL